MGNLLSALAHLALSLIDLAMVYLLMVAIAAACLGRGPAVMVSLFFLCPGRHLGKTRRVGGFSMDDSEIRVLVVDDERAIRRFLRTLLNAHGYLVYEAENGQRALVSAVNYCPHIVILDLGLPDLDGTEVTRRLREWSKVPIIILSVREQEHDKVEVLDAGADDYLTKPFGAGELMARIRVALRHALPVESSPLFKIDDLTVDLARHLVLLGEKEVFLTPTEYELLRILVQNAGKVLTHRQLLNQVWGAAYASKSHLLRVNISSLRQKIELDPARPHYILTELGVGYRLWAPV